MKILKYLFYFLIAFIFIFCLIGLIYPEFDYKNEVVINKPVEQVWKVFTDGEKMDQWLIGLKSVEIVKGQPDEIGSQFKLKFVEDGHEMEVIETVTAFEANKRFAFDLDSDVFKGKTDIRMEPMGDKTKLTAVNSVDGHNLVYDAMFFFMKGSFKDNGQKSYDLLKKLAEGELQ